MSLWHCKSCARELEAPDGSLMHFHKCVDPTSQDTPVKIRGLPPDEEGRDDLWHGLLSIVAKVHPLIDP